MNKASNSRVCRLLGLVLVVTCIVALLPVNPHVHGYETENTLKSDGDVISVGGTCGDCTITYKFEKTKKTLTRSVYCGKEFYSWEIPGWTQPNPKKSGSQKQNGIEKVTSSTGKAHVWKWSGKVGNLTRGHKETCDITYLKPSQLVYVALDPSGAILDEEGNVLMSYSCSWKDDTIQYTFTNSTNSDLIVTWNNTPFSQIVKAGKQMICKKYTRTVPDVVLRDMIIKDIETGDVTVLEVVTFIPSTTIYIPINALKKVNMVLVAI